MANQLGELIAAEAARAETDFQSFRNKALSVVAVAGGLVALVTGFLSVAAGSEENILPSGARCILAAAMLAFVSATMCALKINLPTEVTLSDESALATFVEEEWEAEDWDKQVASLMVDYLRSLRAANASAAKWLVAAIALEIAGIFFTAIMAVVVVASLPS